MEYYQYSDFVVFSCLEYKQTEKDLCNSFGSIDYIFRDHLTWEQFNTALNRLIYNNYVVFDGKYFKWTKISKQFALSKMPSALFTGCIDRAMRGCKFFEKIPILEPEHIETLISPELYEQGYAKHRGWADKYIAKLQKKSNKSKKIKCKIIR